MHRTFPANTNCYHLRGGSIHIAQGLPLGDLAGGRRGVALSGSRGSALGIPLGTSCAQPVTSDGGHVLCSAWLTPHNVLCGQDETSPKQTLIQLSGIMEISLDRGEDEVRLGLAAGPRPIDQTSPARFSKHTNGILCLSHPGAGCAEVTVTRVVLRSRPPFVVGLTVNERGRDGQPLLWWQLESRYRQNLQRALEEFERTIRR